MLVIEFEIAAVISPCRRCGVFGFDLISIFFPLGKDGGLFDQKGKSSDRETQQMKWNLTTLCSSLLVKT